MHHPRQHRRLALAVAVAMVLLAACGQATQTGQPTAAPTAAVTLAPTVVPTATPAQPTDTPEPTDSDTGSPGTPACAIEDLKASRGITEVDGDDRTTEVVLVAAGTCSVNAFPALLLEDADANILVAANAAGSGGTDLVPGVAYSSTVRLSNWCLGQPSYPVRIGVLQGIGTLLVTGDSFPDEGDLPPCVHQDADPVLSGTAWTPKS